MRPRLIVAVFCAWSMSAAAVHPQSQMALSQLIIGGHTKAAMDAINRALPTAARNGDLKLVKYILEELKFDVDHVPSDNRYELGNAALHQAVIGNHLNIVKYLLKMGADVHKTGKYRDGFTPHMNDRSTREEMIFFDLLNILDFQPHIRALVSTLSLVRMALSLL